MKISVTTILLISLFSKIAVAISEKAKFYKAFLSAQESGIVYKRVAGWYFGPVPPNAVQCAFPCMIEDNCTSVYMDGEACVFGLRNSTAFEEGEVVTPNPNQTLRVKGRAIFNVAVSIINII